MTLPGKIRHLEFSQVEVALSEVFGNGLDVLEYRVDDAGRHHDAFLVVEEYVVVAVAFLRSCDLAHSMQRPGYVRQIPAELDTAMLAAQEGRTFAISFYCFSSCA